MKQMHPDQTRLKQPYMKYLRRAALLGIIALATACTSNTEMPNNNAAGSDEMKPSPCVCNQINYTPKAFQWTS